MPERLGTWVLISTVACVGRSPLLGSRDYQLVVTAEPTSLEAGEPLVPAIGIELRDADGALVSNAATLTLAWSAAVPAGALRGTLSVMARDGVAVFDDVWLDGACNDCQLTVSADNGVTVDTAAFDVFPHRPIYRSVSPGHAAALASAASSSDGLTIGGVTATFPSPLPDPIGVGDALVYNSGADVAFIHGRASPTTLQVRDAAGAEPAPTSDDGSWAIYRAYTSLAEVSSGAANPSIGVLLDSGARDITASGSNEVWNIACYHDGGGPDGGATITDAWITGRENLIRIYTPTRVNEVGASQRHRGTWDTGKFSISVTAGDGLLINSNYVWVDGLQAELDHNTTWDAVAVQVANITGPGEIWVSNTIARHRGGPATADDGNRYGGIKARVGVDDVVMKIWNNIVYDFAGTGGYADSAIQNAGRKAYVYNNTVYNCARNITNQNPAEPMVAINNIVQTDTATGCYQGIFDEALSSNNIANCPSAPGLNPRSGTATFASILGRDFHLSPVDSLAIDAGVDLDDDTLSRDIDGELRAGGSWDIGADEYPAP